MGSPRLEEQTSSSEVLADVGEEGVRQCARKPMFAKRVASVRSS